MGNGERETVEASVFLGILIFIPNARTRKYRSKKVFFLLFPTFPLKKYLRRFFFRPRHMGKRDRKAIEHKKEERRKRDMEGPSEAAIWSCFASISFR